MGLNYVFEKLCSNLVRNLVLLYQLLIVRKYNWVIVDVCSPRDVTVEWQPTL